MSSIRQLVERRHQQTLLALAGTVNRMNRENDNPVYGDVIIMNAKADDDVLKLVISDSEGIVELQLRVVGDSEKN